MDLSVVTQPRLSLATLVKIMSDPRAIWSQSYVMASKSPIKTLLHPSGNPLASLSRTKYNMLWSSTTAIRWLMATKLSHQLVFNRTTPSLCLAQRIVAIQRREPPLKKTSSKTFTSRMNWTDKIHSTFMLPLNKDNLAQWHQGLKILRFSNKNWSKAVGKALLACTSRMQRIKI